MHFARKMPLPEGGERVVLVTDRRIGFWEAANQPRSIDYPFTVIELRLNSDGEGEGKMSIATKVISDKDNNIVTLENYDIAAGPVDQRATRKASHRGATSDRPLVVTQPDEGCVTQAAVTRPFGERDFRDQLRLHPPQRPHLFGGDAFAPMAAFRRRQVGERAALGGQRLHERSDLGSQVWREARTDFAGAEESGPRSSRPAASRKPLRRLETADHEFLMLGEADFHPRVAAAAGA